MHAGEVVKLLRIKKKISQISFAKKTGISANYLSLIENGKRIPRTEYYRRAAEVLVIPVNLLLWEEVNLSNFQDKKARSAAEKIEKKLVEIKELLFKELINANAENKKS